MPTKVYIGGTAKDTSQEELEEAFRKFGTCKMLFVARNPPGFAYIEFDAEPDAQDAIRALHDQVVAGSKIRVEVAKASSGPKKSRSDFRGPSGGAGAHDDRRRPDDRDRPRYDDRDRPRYDDRDRPRTDDRDRPRYDDRDRPHFDDRPRYDDRPRADDRDRDRGERRGEREGLSGASASAHGSSSSGYERRGSDVHDRERLPAPAPSARPRSRSRDRGDRHASGQPHVAHAPTRERDSGRRDDGRDRDYPARDRDYR